MSQGDYVVLACEGHCLCGVDVAAPHQLRYGHKPLVETLNLMRQQLVEPEVRQQLLLLIERSPQPDW
jgi:hypothetical protein